MATTWNPADKHANITLSNGDLTAATTNTAWESVRSILGVSSGKYYWEVTIDVSADPNFMIGAGTASATLSNHPGYDANGYGYNAANGNKYLNNSPVAYGDSYTTNDVVSVALDLDNGKIWWGKNGTWQASGDPAAGTNEAYSGLSGTFYAMVGLYFSGNEVTANFGASAFTYTVPTGFNAGLSDFSGEFSGIVYEQGSPVQRSLYLYRRDTGAYVDTTTSSGDGYYTLSTTYSGAHFIVCLDDAAGDDFNDLIIGNVIPTTVSG